MRDSKIGCLWLPAQHHDAIPGHQEEHLAAAGDICRDGLHPRGGRFALYFGRCIAELSRGTSEKSKAGTQIRELLRQCQANARAASRDQHMLIACVELSTLEHCRSKPSYKPCKYYACHSRNQHIHSQHKQAPSNACSLQQRSNKHAITGSFKWARYTMRSCPALILLQHEQQQFLLHNRLFSHEAVGPACASRSTRVLRRALGLLNLRARPFSSARSARSGVSDLRDRAG